MDLIAQVVAAVLSFLAGIVGNIFAHDICASADSVCAKIVKAAAARLAAFDQASTEQEWLADLRDYETVTEKYRHAVGCFLAAPKMRRCALEAPFVGEAPGIVWKERRNGVWEARWKASPNALEQGWKLKSMKIWSGYKSDLTAGDKDFVVDTTLSLQTEHDRWLHDPTYRMEEEARRAEWDRKIEKLIALGHTRKDAVDIIFLARGEKIQEWPE